MRTQQRQFDAVSNDFFSNDRFLFLVVVVVVVEHPFEEEAIALAYELFDDNGSL